MCEGKKAEGEEAAVPESQGQDGEEPDDDDDDYSEQASGPSKMRMMTNRQIKKSEEAEAMNEDDKDDDGNSETPPVKKTERCRSMTNVQSLATGFPTMHYIALAFLALSICLSFLVATDQSRHILESMQVRMLWSILIGSFTSLAVVCFDLSRPFAGAYKAR